LGRPGGRNWYALLHLGVMRMEHFDLCGAQAAWEESLRLEPSSWAWRNLGALAVRRGETDQALDFYRRAWELLPHPSAAQLALAIEYFQLLVQNAAFQQGLDLFRSLPDEIRTADRVQILYGWISLALGNFAAVESVLEREFAVIREGETSLTDLWFELHSAQECGKRWEDLDSQEKLELARRYPPPPHIDFRSSGQLS